ncbi:BtpA/SgcQ family protein [Pseudaestuariivita atlantica]|uniref:Adenine phosphoribosyltransferase n=1 Tax=Pseudaestuariivita atlantica TaxID=1317121 RepID=A0A0L1JN18_9RHOB|nr:BtpA/SgcQ family protein [Pseudaestuariivita atlantica]KNG93102.1 adenine phosphoribosyltransferase [Pseudaestuariivita atlantica]
MNRAAFRSAFGTQGPVVLPVIHVLETKRTLANIDVLVGEGAPGCFLINHDFGVEPFLPIIREVRAARPDLWIGLNFLAVTGLEAFPQLASLSREGCRIDAYWADDARIDERTEAQPEAAAIAAARDGWDGLYFGGTAFKKQRPVDPGDYGRAATIARDWMDVVCTSGAATGIEAEDTKIATFRAACGDTPLALASGITPDNAHRYAGVDAFMVATGINFDDNFYDIDPARLRRLLDVAETLGEPA